MAGELETGFISINGINPMMAGAPFGGNKLSGIGREGGRQGLEEFMRPKNVYIELD